MPAKKQSRGELRCKKAKIKPPHPLPSCPSIVPTDVERQLKRVASLWAKHSARPRLEGSVAKHWDNLIESWSNDNGLPLLIRKKEKGIAYGRVLTHKSKRRLVLTDNSPASWSYMLAFAKKKPNLKEIQRYLQRNTIPVAMVLVREMARLRYKCIPDRTSNPNILGWKVCHRTPVRLLGKGTVKQRDITRLKSHFKAFLKPSNMFLVPLKLGCLGELPHVIDAINKEDGYVIAKK